jgi:HEAT repeat protein
MVHVARQDAIPYLTEALADDDPWVRYFSARSLDVHRAVETTSDLYRLASSDKFHQVRIAAFEALSRMDEKLAASVAGSFLTSTDEDLRQVASNFLALRNGTV